MSQGSGARPGCLRRIVQVFLLLVAAVLGVLAWDVWQLRALRPPDDRSFEGFVRSGRRGVLMIQGERLFWVAPYPKTIVPSSEPPVYQFNRSGELVNWTPGTKGQTGMMSEAPVRADGVPSTVEQVRAWLLRGEKGGKPARP